MMGPKCGGEGIGQNVEGQAPHLLRYHLLGVLCWLYPVGYPRIIYIYIIYTNNLLIYIIIIIIITIIRD